MASSFLVTAATERRAEATAGYITTVAGYYGGPSNSSGDGGPATSAGIYNPFAVSFDGSGNMFFADNLNDRIRRVDAVTQVITTIAGSSRGFSGDGGQATSAQLNQPKGVAADVAGNVYISDTLNDRIRRVDAVTQQITTIVGTGVGGFSGDGGPATSAAIYHPWGIVVDSAGNLYFADTGNNRVRRVDAATQIITTMSAAFSHPVGVAIDSAQNLYVGDYYPHRVRKIDGATQAVTTIAGTGVPGWNGDNQPASAAQLDHPRGVAVGRGGHVFIADAYNNRVRRVDAVTGQITTVAGSGGNLFNGDNQLATLAGMNQPEGLGFDRSGNLYITELNNLVRRVEAVGTPATITVTPAAGLRDGRVVTVSGGGFTPGATIGVAQCKDGGTAAQCGAAYQTTTASATGTYSVQFTVARSLAIPGETVNCAASAGTCVIGAAETADVAGTAVTKPIAFSAIAASPSTGLTHLATITVSGTGFTPGDLVLVGQCVTGVMGQTGCGTNGTGVVATTGSFTTTITVHNPLNIGGVPVNCSTPGACVIGAAEADDVAGSGVTTPVAFT